MIDDLDLSEIQDEKAREVIGRLLNLVEKLSTVLREVQAENQRFSYEINRMKGEQGKPKIKGNVPKPPESVDHSSEKERQKARPRHKSSKKAKIIIDRTEVLEVDPAILPIDAQFKGYEDVVV